MRNKFTMSHRMIRFDRLLREAKEIPETEVDPMSLCHSLSVDPVGIWQRDVVGFLAWARLLPKHEDEDPPENVEMKTISHVVNFANRVLTNPSEVCYYEAMALVHWCVDRITYVHPSQEVK